MLPSAESAVWAYRLKTPGSKGTDEAQRLAGGEFLLASLFGSI